MIKTKQFEFDRKGCITVFEPINAQRVVNLCTLHARRKKIKKPYLWGFVPTLTN